MKHCSLSQLIRPVLLTGLLLGMPLLAEHGSGEPSTKQSREALESLNQLIGEWRGTGQLRRGSSRGAWRQTGEFVWDFSQETPAIKYLVNDGKLVEEGLLTWSPEEKFQLKLSTGDDDPRIYSGNWQQRKLVLETKAKDNEVQHRITLTPLNEKRTLVLHEKTSAGGSSFFRVAEVGYTRAGTRLALPGGGKRECVVTGGTAQTPVSYMGETYYVCCSGCKQAFDDDPAGIIADFKARIKERLNSLETK